MLVIAAAALTAGSVTVAVIAPINLLLAITLGPIAGTGAALLAAILIARRRSREEQDGAEADKETDRMVAALSEIRRQAGPTISPASATPYSRRA